MVVTDSTRNAVWQEMLDTARLVRYYDRLASKHQHRHIVTRLVLLASAIAGVAALVNQLPATLGVLAGAAIGVLMAVDFLADFANKAAVLHFISRECNAVDDDLATLWGDVQSDAIEDAEARRTLTDLRHRITRTTDWAGSAHIPTDEQLNIRCAEAAYKALADQHAHG